MKFVCTICLDRLKVRGELPFNKTDTIEMLGTCLAHFATRAEYEWHMSNIHNQGKREPVADSMNCWVGGWG